MTSKSRLPKPYIAAYWAEVEAILINKYRASAPNARAAIGAFRQRFGKHGGITLYNTDPAEMAATIGEQELIQEGGVPIVPRADGLATRAKVCTTANKCVGCIRRDLGFLQQSATEERWTNETPVPPTVFGPMWPAGLAPAWALNGRPKTTVPEKEDESPSDQGVAS